MSIQTRIAVMGVGFVLIFALGFWLSRAGKPYSPVVFTLHKLLTLGLMVFLGLTIAAVQRGTPLGGSQILAIAFTAVCLVTTMATGGIMSASATTAPVVHRLHQFVPYLTVVSTAAMFYFLV